MTQRVVPLTVSVAALSIAFARPAAAQTPPATAPAASAPAPSAAPATPTLEQILEQLSRLDPKLLNDRLAGARARHKALTDETGPLRAKVAANEVELPRLTLKTQLLDALVKARGTAAAPAGTPNPDGGPVDALLEQLAGIDPKAMSDRLAQMQARIKALGDELAAIKPKVAANEAEAGKLAMEINLLEALVKAKGSLPGAAPPAEAPKKAEASVPSPPTAMQPMQNAAPAAPVPAGAVKPPAEGMAAPSPVLAAAGAPPPAAAPPVNFADHVLPIITASCLGCHNPDKAKGGLVLDNYASAMTGGSSGAVIVPGAPDRSRLFRLVSHVEEPYMPPLAAKLEDAKLAVIRRWIEAGAPADASSKVAAAKAATPGTAVASKPPSAAAIDPDAAPIPTGLPKGPVRKTANVPPATALAVSPAAAVLALAGEGQILYYDTQKGELLGVLEFPEGRVEHLCFSRDGTLLVAAGGQPGQSGVVVVFEVESGRRVGQFDRLYDTVLAADISPENDMIAVGGTNRRVRVFDLYSGSRLFEIAAHNDWIYDVRFSPDPGAPALLATADRSGGLYCWEADTGRDVHPLRGHVGAVTAVAFSADSLTLASSGADGTLRLWEMEEGRLVRQWGAHAGPALCVAMSAQGQLATSGADGLVKLWKPDGTLVRAFENQGDWVYRVAFTPDGKGVICGAWSGAVTLFEAESGKVVRRFRTQPD